MAHLLTIETLKRVSVLDKEAKTQWVLAEMELPRIVLKQGQLYREYQVRELVNPSTFRATWVK